MSNSPSHDMDPARLFSPPSGLYNRLTGTVPLDRAALDSWLARGSSTAGGFRLDADAARECVKRMRRAVDDLREIEEASQPYRVLPTPLDLVSQNFVQNCAFALQEARNYFLTWREQLEDAIDSLEEQIKSYGVAEQQNRINLT